MDKDKRIKDLRTDLAFAERRFKELCEDCKKKYLEAVGGGR